MILDHIDQGSRYTALHPGLAAGLQWLAQWTTQLPPPGRTDIDGERLLALVSQDAGKGREAARIEYHRRYLDIQMVFAGVDTIGWLPLGQCTREAAAYDEQRDVGFFDDRPQDWLTVRPAHFAIFFPTDGHAPLAGEGPLHKAVVKVAMDWNA